MANRQQAALVNAEGRRLSVAKLYLEGHSLRAIGAALDCSHGTVKNDLDSLRAEWLEASLVDFDEAKARELSKIDNLEAVSWAAWERSCLPAETHKARNVKGRTVKETTRTKELTTSKNVPAPDVSTTERTVEYPVGDESFLARVAWCIEKRCDILGLDAPKKIAATDAAGNDLTLNNVLAHIKSAPVGLPAPPENVIDIEFEPAKPPANDAVNQSTQQSQ